MKLIENPKSALKAYSTWALGVATAIPAIWVTYPELHALVPPQYMAAATGAVTLLGLLGRFVHQPSVTVAATPKTTVQDVGEAVGDMVVDKAQEIVKQQGDKLVKDAIKSISKKAGK